MMLDVSFGDRAHLMEYFCLTNISGITAKFKHTVLYPNLPLTMKPVLHNGHLLAPGCQECGVKMIKIKVVYDVLIS
jgi:hypothetical protein